MKKTHWNQLSEEGKIFVRIFGESENTVDYIEDTKNKSVIVLQNKGKIIFNWNKIRRSAK